MHSHTHMHIFTCVYMCLYVCICMNVCSMWMNACQHVCECMYYMSVLKFQFPTVPTVSLHYIILFIYFYFTFLDPGIKWLWCWAQLLPVVYIQTILILISYHQISEDQKFGLKWEIWCSNPTMKLRVFLCSLNLAKVVKLKLRYKRMKTTFPL